MKILFMGRGRAERGSRRASDHVQHHAPNWRQAVAACLVFFLAGLAATGITLHNAANADERHHVPVPPGQMTLVAVRGTATRLAAPPSVKGIAFSADGRLLAGAYSDGAIWLWNRATGQGHALTPPASSLVSANSVAFSPGGELLAGAYSDGSIRLWNPAAGQVTRNFLPPGPGGGKGADAVAFSPDGRLLVGAYGDGTVWQWNPATGQGALLTVPSAASADAVAFSRNGTLLAAAYTDGTIRLWNPATGRGMVITVPSAASADAVAFSPDGTLLASDYTDGTIRLWNPATGRLARSLLRASPSGRGMGSGVAFSPDGNLLASAYGNGTLRLWHLETGQHGGLASGGWLVTTASVTAIVLSALAAAVTTREIRRAGRRLPGTGRQLWRSCC